MMRERTLVPENLIQRKFGDFSRLCDWCVSAKLYTSHLKQHPGNSDLPFNSYLYPKTTPWFRTVTYVSYLAIGSKPSTRNSANLLSLFSHERRRVSCPKSISRLPAWTAFPPTIYNRVDSIISYYSNQTSRVLASKQAVHEIHPFKADILFRILCTDQLAGKGIV